MPPVSGREDGFLARWSRRKIEVRRDEAHPPAPPPGAEDAPVPEDGPAAELTPEAIEALPKIEDLTPETDITAFLRKGVPDALRNAALRRMWSLDPAIRDHVGDARDYAYDWNVPGGVPGNGPLLPGDDVEAMLRGMFPEDGPETATAEAPTESTRPPSQVRDHAGRPAAGADAQAASGEGSSRESAEGQGGPKALPVNAIGAPEGAEAGAPDPEADAETVQMPRPRRHGGAKPV